MVRGVGSVIRIVCIAAATCATPARADGYAQAVTTASIAGTVRTTDGAAVDGARIIVRSDATGFVVESGAPAGRFLVQGLESGGRYTVTVTLPGYRAGQRENVFLSLGERIELDFVLGPDVIPLEPLQVIACTPAPRTFVPGGTTATVDDSLLHRLPALNRDLYDFVRLVPQISTRTGFRTGFSGGGVGLRYDRPRASVRNRLHSIASSSERRVCAASEAGSWSATAAASRGRTLR